MILVTGGAGYIGSHVLFALAQQSREKVVVVDNLCTGSTQALLHDEIFEQLDLADTKSLEKVFRHNRPETVMHFAAHLDVGESVQKPLMYYQNNTANTFSLLDLCVKYAVKNFIFSSTAAVYGRVENSPVTEDFPTMPLSPYGWSKLMSEQAIQDTAKASDLRFVILRYFNVAGCDPEARIGQHGRKAHHLIKVCFETALGIRDHVQVFGTDYDTVDGTGVRDYIHVCDLAQAHLDGLTYLQKGGKSDIFNVGYGRGYSVKEIIHTVEKVTGKKLKVVYGARRDGDSPEVTANSSKLQTNTSWKPQYDTIEEIISHAWNWERKLNTRVDP